MMQRSSGKRKRLLLVSTRIFWPADVGHKILLYNYCRGLYDHYQYDIYVYTFLEYGQDFDEKDKPYFIKKVIRARLPGRLQAAANILRHSLAGRNRWSFQSSLYYSRYNKLRIEELIRRIRPDAVMFDLVRTSRYIDALKGFDGLKTIFMEDALSKRYARQIKAVKNESGIGGRYEAFLPGWLCSIINSRHLKNFLLKEEIRRLLPEELEAAKNFDALIYVNRFEAGDMNKRSGKDNAYTVTMGADCDHFGEELQIEKVPNTLSFVGNMTVAANADSVRMIMDRIMPLIPSRPVIHFIGEAPDSLREEYRGNPQCVFEGVVDDIRKYVESTLVVLSPIAYGTGVKTKIIEGMAMSMPVVTNYLGVDGLSAQVGKDLLMSDDFKEMADMTEELLHDEKKRQELGKNGREYALRMHRW
ncbi:MAG: glycosyltransferase, partial [Lachnospiraceae bacterium]|nr:glycosyltransferase [Lachnospiraceae bacterium]